MAAPIIRIRTDQLDFARRLVGLTSDIQLAQQMGVHRSTVRRTLSDAVQPSREFIAGLRAAFPGATFDDLFDVVDDEQADVA
jgi:hypothetical protein